MFGEERIVENIIDRLNVQLPWTCITTKMYNGNGHFCKAHRTYFGANSVRLLDGQQNEERNREARLVLVSLGGTKGWGKRLSALGYVSGEAAAYIILRLSPHLHLP